MQAIHEKGPEVTLLSEEGVTLATVTRPKGWEGVGYVTFKRNRRLLYALVSPFRDIPIGEKIGLSVISMGSGDGNLNEELQSFYVLR